MGTKINDVQRLTEAGTTLVFNSAAKMPMKKYYEQIVTEKTEPKQIGKYDSMGNLGPAYEKTPGDAHVFGKTSQAYQTTITSKTYGNAVEADLEAMEYGDVFFNVIKSTFGTPLIKTLLTKKERLVAAAYNGAFTDTGADGVAIISASHPLVNSASVNDNLATGAFGNDSFIAAKNKFNAIYDHSGEFFDTEPTHLLVHPNKLYLALQILTSQLMALELSNTKNVTNDVMPVKVITNKYLSYNNSTGVSPWFLIDKTMTDAGCILQKKRGLALKTWWENNNDVYRGTATELYGVAFISPGFGIIGSTGA